MTPVIHDVKAALILIVALAMVVFICAVAGLGAVLRPVRWSDRKQVR